LHHNFFRSYLFGDVLLVPAEAEPEDPAEPVNAALNPNQVNPINVEVDLGAAHQALLQREGPTGFQPYNKPILFPLRVSHILYLQWNSGAVRF